MKRISIILAAALLAACGTGNKKPMETPKDLLVHRLFTFAEEGKIAYGHQDDLCYGHAWRVEDWENDQLERSDVKDVTGKYPMVLGFDLGDIEHAADKNLDGVPFGLIRKAALTHIQRGGIVTFSWHPDNILTGGNAWDVSSNQVVKSILPEGENHAEFMVWLQRAADFLESLGDVSVIFRPWHEHTGSWFWWGRDHCSVEEYVALFRMTHDYLAVERGMDNIVWCYSPGHGADEAMYLERWPGDDVVDLLGLDCYTYLGPEGIEAATAVYRAQVGAALDYMTRLGEEKGKLICLSETGLEGIPDPHWWMQTLYPTIQGAPIAYVLTWRNACDKPGHFYGPWKGFAHEEDFRQFAASEKIELL